MKGTMHFNSSTSVHEFPVSRGNEITKEYYWFLVGEINRGTIRKSVCRVENHTHGTERYFLTSYYGGRY